MSAEPGRKAPYSADLRWRVVYQRIVLNLPLYSIAKNLNIATTAHRVYQLFKRTGCKRLERRDIRTLNVYTELHVLGFVLENPAVYLPEVCDCVRDITGEIVSAPTAIWIDSEKY